MIAVCTPRARTPLQRAGKGHQWWARDVYHLRGEGNRTLCGRDCSDWLTIGEIEPDHNCCVRCAAKVEAVVGNEIGEGV